MAFQTNEFESHKPQFSTFCGSCLHVGCIVLGFSERTQEPVVCPFAFGGASDLWTTFLCCGGIKLSFLLAIGCRSRHMSCKIQIPGLVHFVVHVFMSSWGGLRIGRIVFVRSDYPFTDCFQGALLRIQMSICCWCLNWMMLRKIPISKIPILARDSQSWKVYFVFAVLFVLLCLLCW